MGLRKSFTLIEMLVVMTLFSLVGVAVTSSFVSGMKIWRRANDMGPKNIDVLLFMEKMAKNLRQGLNTEKIKFEGEKDRVSFPVLRGDYLVKMVYGFDALAGVVWRKEKRFEDLIGDDRDTEEDYSRENLLSAKAFSLSYFYFDEEEKGYLWGDGWNGQPGEFLGIRWVVRVDDNEFVKTIFIGEAGSFYE